MASSSDKDSGSAEVFNHTIKARSEDRSRLAADVEAFLESGGDIEEVPRNLRADPPRKPQNNYGRGSL